MKQVDIFQSIAATSFSVKRDNLLYYYVPC